MDFILSSILSGVLWDVIKTPGTVTGKYIKRELERQWLDDYTCEVIANRINSLPSKTKDDLETFKTAVINDEEINKTLQAKIGYRTEFAKRLDYIIDSINGFSKETINAEYLGEFLGFSSVNELKCYYISDNEPTYTFIDNIASSLGVNKEWLKNGNGNPFNTELPRYHRAVECLKDISNIKPQRIMFALSDQPRPYWGIIMKINKLKFEYFPFYYKFNSDVGGEGQSQIFSIYDLINELKINQQIDICEVRKIPNEIFEKVFSGEIYSGAVYSQGRQERGYWLYDFLDLFDNESKEETYRQSYGEAFVECQRIVKAIKKLNE